MDTQNLKAFAAVAKSGSFSAAANELQLTQPAISKRISLLENELGTPLFDRTGRRARLTQAGDRLLLRALSILQQLKLAEQEIRDLSTTVSGSLNLATSHHIGLHRLPPVLRAFSDHYPQVRLNIEFTDSEKAHEAVLRGDIELAVITLAPDESNSIKAHTLWSDPLIFVAGLEHPLRHRKTLSLADLSACENVLPGMDTYTGQIVKRLFEQQALPLDTLMTTNYLETIKMMVNVGLGWSVLPRTMLDDGLIELPVSCPALSRQLGYVFHRKHSLSNAARAFIDLLEQRKAGNNPIAPLRFTQ
jgi:DNA-binding transcriptional LysR family regulator